VKYVKISSVCERIFSYNWSEPLNNGLLFLVVSFILTYICTAKKFPDLLIEKYTALFLT